MNLKKTRIYCAVKRKKSVKNVFQLKFSHKDTDTVTTIVPEDEMAPPFHVKSLSHYSTSARYHFHF